jgi:hypothetical protein
VWGVCVGGGDSASGHAMLNPVLKDWHTAWAYEGCTQLSVLFEGALPEGALPRLRQGGLSREFANGNRPCSGFSNAVVVTHMCVGTAPVCVPPQQVYQGLH